MASRIIDEMRSGSGGIKQSGENTLSFTSSVSFLVVTDDKRTTREEVLLGTVGLPVVGLAYGPLAATCTGMEANRREAMPLYWDVVCSFESGRERQRQNPAAPSNDPTTWIPIFTPDGFLTKEVPLLVDKTPAGVTNAHGQTGPCLVSNSALQPFDDPIVEKKTIVQFSFVQFEDASQSLRTLMARNDCVNSVTFDGYAARTLLINLMPGTELGTYGGYYAWRCVYQVTYDPDTHDEKRLDVGSVYRLVPPGTAGPQFPYFESTNTFPIVGGLNGTGNTADLENAATLAFRPKTQIDFSTFIRT